MEENAFSKYGQIYAWKLCQDLCQRSNFFVREVEMEEKKNVAQMSFNLHRVHYLFFFDSVNRICDIISFSLENEKERERERKRERDREREKESAREKNTFSCYQEL